MGVFAEGDRLIKTSDSLMGTFGAVETCADSSRRPALCPFDDPVGDAIAKRVEKCTVRPRRAGAHVVCDLHDADIDRRVSDMCEESVDKFIWECGVRIQK